MASISNDGGRRIIQFVDTDKKRKSIRIGKTSQRNAESVRLRVEQLLAAKISGHAFDRDLSQWVRKLESALYAKLAAVGLVERRESAKLAGFIDGYIRRRTDLKKGTILNLKQTRGYLVECFGADRAIQGITEGDADEFRQFLLRRGMAENSVRRHCGRARQFFNAAKRKRIIEENPFSEIPCTVNANHERFYYVEVTDAQKILEACPDQQWRTIFALCRWGGLRCPSEIMPLTWADVDWQNDRLQITSPKTAHQGKGARVIPLFPELRSELEAAFEQAEPGTEYVITRYRESNTNLRTQMNKIIKRAGLEPWGKPFQNLRSTRETELAEQFPMHVVCRWIGNSELVAAKHYLQMRNEHFDKAVQNPVQSLQGTASNGKFSESSTSDETLENSSVSQS